MPSLWLDNRDNNAVAAVETQRQALRQCEQLRDCTHQLKVVREQERSRSGSFSRARISFFRASGRTKVGLALMYATSWSWYLDWRAHNPR